MNSVDYSPSTHSPSTGTRDVAGEVTDSTIVTVHPKGYGGGGGEGVVRTVPVTDTQKKLLVLKTSVPTTR